MGSRQADQACTEPRGTHASGSMSVGGASARGTEQRHVPVTSVSGSTPLDWRLGWWVSTIRGGRLRGERGVTRLQCRSSKSYLCVGVSWRSRVSVG